MKLKINSRGIAWDTFAIIVVVVAFVVLMLYFLYQSRYEMYAYIDKFFG